MINRLVVLYDNEYLSYTPDHETINLEFSDAVDRVNGSVSPSPILPRH